MTTEPRRPRLLLVSHSYRPERTPPARRWGAVVAALRSAGWDVDVVAPGGVRPFAGPDGERVLPTPRLPLGEAGRNGRFAEAVVHALLAIPRGMATRRPDVVVATVPALPVVVPGVVLSRLWRRPLVLEMRDAWPDLAHEAGVHQGLLGAAMERVVTGGQRAARLVVTVTDGFAETLRGRGVRVVRTLGNGVDLARLAVAPRRERAAGELHVLYLGNMGESQGLERLVEAAAALRASHPGVRVRIVGEGTRREDLEALDARLGGAAEILGPVAGEDVAAQYAWADTLVVALRADWPSFRHTVPSKTYEVLAVGRHVTGMVTGEAARTLEDAGGADVVGPRTEDLVAHLAALAADPARTDVGTGARAWVAAHADLRAVSARYERLLRALADTR
ncbi:MULTISPECIES: glycosyltransferase family 4 protein [Micrococcus]|uniref:glycosyltransferase family 4 protein n=1 Tax=Micrococcus TaxID=1269 RepID=UPI0022AF3BB4|nr:glycosyltransferase family 4 protein [Micrococcus sp. H39-S4]MCV7455272.1 glycosyltransferase family 4 protein [Micrococcus luteus]MCV7542217.1 glycosyltransferase family 4 protein [Micrococcus luteus]MCV7556879.1 glycosyltransferase family 4 protein [Micrococcus luteus]MCV7607546.1 glycosyltransferase family 4 protein [Micrococcus luteus]MCZ4069497.1 glycosyltransferase family 4 protein [Micrococcus sp. H39-S4]